MRYVDGLQIISFTPKESEEYSKLLLKFQQEKEKKQKEEVDQLLKDFLAS